MAAPSVLAEQILAAALTPVRCCRSKPGLARPARMLSMRKAWPVAMDSANAVRRICPPPSPREPSRVIIGAVPRCEGGQVPRASDDRRRPELRLRELDETRDPRRPGVRGSVAGLTSRAKFPG